MAHDASAPRELLRILRRHPRQLPERLMLLAVAQLGEPTRAWAEAFRARAAAGDTDAAAAAHDIDAAIAARCARLLHDTALASRVDGAVAGTPFFIALVPAYVAFLWTQAQMVLRIAALQGHDPSDPAIAAELLALRGVHPSVEAASAALATLDDEPSPRVGGWRERIVAWVQLVRRILVLAAFASPGAPDEEKPPRRRQIVFGLLGLVIWLGTYVFPVTFMVVLAWGCESSTRQLGPVALAYYGVGVLDDEGAGAGGRLARARAHLALVRSPRRLVWAISIGLSFAVPLGLIAIAVSNHLHHGPWVTFVAPIAGLSLVLALTRSVTRRA